jgi:hypothetical protein
MQTKKDKDNSSYWPMSLEDQYFPRPDDIDSLIVPKVKPTQWPLGEPPKKDTSEKNTK